MSSKRVLLKLSGEALLGNPATAGRQESGIDFSVLGSLSDQLLEVQKAGYQVAVVVGAGNIWRFRDNNGSGIDRVSSDYMGMLATIMNSMALMSAIQNQGGQARVCSALSFPVVVDLYTKRLAHQYLNEGKIVICAAGTGNPFFTTDSAAALRALELECDLLLKGTNTDGVYDSDPKKNGKAKKYDTISFDEVLEKNLKVMDGAAIALCRDGNMPIQVFQFGEAGAILSAIQGKIGTKVYS
ncbi:MAG: UMP kinase [bacterium]|nr:UMP kinase [bacterium]